MPSLHKTPTGYRVHWRELGRQRAASYPNKREATKAAKALAARLAAQRPATGRPLMTIHEVAARYHAATAYSTDAYAAAAAAKLTRAIAAGGWTYPRDIDRDAVTTLPLGRYRLVRALLRYAASIGQPIDAAALHTRRKAASRRPEPPLLTAVHVAESLALALRWGPSYHLALHLISTYGHRPVSILALAPTALQAGTLTLSVKGGDVHAHPVLPATTALWTGAGALPWVTAEGKPLTPQRLTSWYYHQIGAKVHPAAPGIYELKRYAISQLFAAGCDPKTVASITGHRTPALLLNTYARTNADRQAAALAALATLPAL